MDGCWQPWLIGCRIDWQAWGAIATLLAVGVALFVASAERRDRRRSERAEARLIATILEDVFRRGYTVLEPLGVDVDLTGETGGFLLDVFAKDRARAQEMLDLVSQVHLSEVQRFTHRLHVLPAYTAETIALAYSAKHGLQSALLQLIRLPGSCTEEAERMAALAVKSAVSGVLQFFEKATIACLATQEERSDRDRRLEMAVEQWLSGTHWDGSGRKSS